MLYQCYKYRIVPETIDQSGNYRIQDAGCRIDDKSKMQRFCSNITVACHTNATSAANGLIYENDSDFSL